MSDWQDISTAPKDGTAILILQLVSRNWRESYMPKDAVRTDECSWSHDDPRLLRFDDKRFAIGYWRPWGGWGNRNSTEVFPTHWQPLPEPPA